MSNSRPKPLLIGLLILQIIFCFAIYFICACIRRRRQHRHHLSLPATAFGPGLDGPKQYDTPPRGLSPALVDSFPIIPCSALKDEKPGCGPALGRLECAVCLSSFRDDQTLRFIPNCQHVFHPVCVDPWLRLHSTCPYCRANLAGPVPRHISGSDPDQGSNPGRRDEPDSVVIVVVKAGGNKEYDDERYTLRLSDEVWREIMPEDTCHSDNRPVVLAGERCPPMGSRGCGDQETPSVSESD